VIVTLALQFSAVIEHDLAAIAKLDNQLSQLLEFKAPFATPLAQNPPPPR
jgi:hypothetical protein